MEGRVEFGQSWDAGSIDCKTRASQGSMTRLETILTDEHGMDHGGSYAKRSTS